MRILMLATAIGLVFASPALALRVTNLDKVPHRITFESGGMLHERLIAPNETTHFHGMPNGRLSLVTSPNPQKGGSLNTQGMLSNYIGNGRDQGVPADIMDDYVIWPGGRMHIQRRMKRSDMR